MPDNPTPYHAHGLGPNKILIETSRRVERQQALAAVAATEGVAAPVAGLPAAFAASTDAGSTFDDSVVGNTNPGQSVYAPSSDSGGLKLNHAPKPVGGRGETRHRRRDGRGAGSDYLASAAVLVVKPGEMRKR